MEQTILRNVIITLSVMINNFLSLKNEIYRKIIHSTSILIPIIYIFIESNIFIVLITLSFFITISINLSYNKKFFNITFLNKIFRTVLRPYELSNLWGSTYMVLGFFIITLLFPKHIVIPAMFITAISDSSAAIIGMKYGKIILINNKTAEGLLAFTITSYILLFFLSGNLNFLIIYMISFLTALIELFTPTRYDNISIPIGASILLLLSHLI